MGRIRDGKGDRRARSRFTFDGLGVEVVVAHSLDAGWVGLCPG